MNLHVHQLLVSLIARRKILELKVLGNLEKLRRTKTKRPRQQKFWTKSERGKYDLGTLTQNLLQPNFFSVAEKMRRKITIESRKLRIITIIGSAGIGKSYIAHKIAKGDFVKAIPSNSGVWFVGAEDEPSTLIIDEFAGQIKLSHNYCSF